MTTFSESIIWEIQNLSESSFCSKYWKLHLEWKNAAKTSGKVFCYLDNCIWIGIVKLSLFRTGYFSSADNVLANSNKILQVNKRDFSQLNWLGRDQWIWKTWCDANFNSAWAEVPCCLSEGPLKGDYFDIYLTTFSESVNSEIQKLWGSIFVSKCLEFNLDFKNTAKNWEKVFSFSDNSIRTGIVKFSLLKRGYFSSASNVLTSSTKILHVNKRDFFQLNWAGNDHWIWQKCCGIDFNSAWQHLPCCLSKGPVEQNFLDIYMTTFSESVFSEIENLRGTSFFSKYLKFQLDFKNPRKDWEKRFCY